MKSLGWLKFRYICIHICTYSLRLNNKIDETQRIIKLA